MKFKNAYFQMNDDLKVLISEIKLRNDMDDYDVGKLIGLSPKTIRNYRAEGLLPQLPYCKVAELAKAAGYEIKLERRDKR